jgi:hypothetical protein
MFMRNADHRAQQAARRRLAVTAPLILFTDGAAKGNPGPGGGARSW